MAAKKKRLKEKRNKWQGSLSAWRREEREGRDETEAPVDLDELLGRHGPSHQQSQNDPDHMAGDRGAKRPTHPLALRPEERNVVGSRAAAGTDRAMVGSSVPRRPPRGRPAFPPAPFRGRVGLISRWKRNMAEAQAAHAMRSLPTLSWSTTVTYSRVQSGYRGVAIARTLLANPEPS